MNKMVLKVCDLCSGSAGFSLALETLGKFKTIFFNDFDEDCCDIVKQNFPNVEITNDDINVVENIPNCDVITAGVPCQPFSLAGKRKGFNDERSNVLFKFMDLVKLKSPLFFILENVSNLKSHDDGKTLQKILEMISGIGYFVKYNIINTSSYIPQNRSRIYFVGFKNKSHFDKFQFEIREEKITEIEKFLEKKVENKYYYTDRFKMFSLLKNNITKHISTNTIYQYRRTHIRENKSGLCPTLTANMGTGGHNVPLILDDNGIRKLTPRECFNLQGFPSHYKLNKSNSCLYRIAGNAISIPVVKDIGKSILKCMDISYEEEKHFEEQNEIQEIRDGIDKYIEYSSCIVSSGGRRPNFPESISENIARIILSGYMKKKIYNSKIGELWDEEKIIEVKCFTSTGPISFGPKEKWNYIVFVDGIQYAQYKFKMYLLHCSNSSNEIQNLKINKTQTFSSQCQSGRRPRIAFDKIFSQLQDKMVLIFDNVFTKENLHE